MNPRQRRGLIFIFLGLLVAAVTFFAVTSYVADVTSQVGPMTTVYRAKSSIEPYTPLTADNVEAVEVPVRWASDTSKLSMDDLQNRRVGFRLEKGSTITSDMLLTPSALDPTEREVAINVDAVTGIAGRVRPGDFVDIYAVFPAEGEAVNKMGTVRVLVRSVRVVTIQGRQSVSAQADQGGTSRNEVIPVTLALKPDDALAVTFAFNFAKEVRLVGLPTDAGVKRSQERDDYSSADLPKTSASAPASSSPAPTTSKGTTR